VPAVAVDGCGRSQHTLDMSARRAFTDSRSSTARWIGHALVYGALLAGGAFLLELIDYKHRAM
jgi:hypothetical protein